MTTKIEMFRRSSKRNEQPMILSPENLASNSSQNYDSVKENLINGVITVDDKLGYLQVVK